MAEYFIRTEDIRPDEILDYFVDTAQDRQNINDLKNRNPTILIGSRGVGKSFLLRVAQKELLDEFNEQRIFPVYISFVKSSLLHTDDPEQFKHWMLARICSSLIRALMKAGLISSFSGPAQALAGAPLTSNPTEQTQLEKLAESYEDSWKHPQSNVDASLLPAIDDLKDAIEDLAQNLAIKRFCLLFDEAAHIFLPEQQRQFFTAFRDLRSHCITCNAAVYPGVTSYGSTFQPSHDATMVYLDRQVNAPEYVETMREIVEKQADSSTVTKIIKNGKNFAVLAYAASGNPRLLLKTLAAAPSLSSSEITDVIKQFYRADIWSEHSLLAEKYSGHRDIVDWGRSFIETSVLPEIKAKNDQYMAADKATSAFFWVHRDCPRIVGEALRVLSYTGIVTQMEAGIKATRSEVGTRYIVNLGCLFALESSPVGTAFDIAKGLTPKRMTEFGANHQSYRSLLERPTDQPSAAAVLETQLNKNIDVLDLSPWQQGKLHELGLATVGDVFRATEEKLKEALYIGDIRARRMRNAAVASVLEYLSG
ncbi:hypothetical protein [Agrobacterium tumefaciens]|uniref:ORC-CDC6 family AAA ATPase n=1 Tax=Agrobacterium tumefaciens TaxID=358 RepID=UPI003B9F7939